MYILALDQGTSSSRSLLFDQDANPVAIAQREFTQYFPQPGWVEHDALEIWQSQLAVCQQVMQALKITAADIAGIGITNQRETTVIWERATGKPIYNAIVWQDRRTAEFCGQLKADGYAGLIQDKTGLVLDAYFSASKIRWLLDNVAGAREQAERGELAFGTIDTWLVWQLTGGALHITDVSNASRTMLFNIDTLQWDDQLLDLFAIPAALLPSVQASSQVYGTTQNADLGSGIPIAAMIGDQQAGLFGQLCWQAGMAKCTYGTGCFLMMNTGRQRALSPQGLLSTLAWQIGDEVVYALEGSVFVGGAVVQWLRDGLELFTQASDSQALAESVDDNGGVVFVPALTGLGAPHWDAQARGAIFGITRGTNKAHLSRAALESIAYQVNDLLDAFSTDSGKPIHQLRIDGGAAMNNLLAQFQADIADIPVVRPLQLESTAQGAAYLAGIAVGLWRLDQLQEKGQTDQIFNGNFTPEKRAALRQQWLKAVDRAKNWLE
ncbi:glycerol kinase GlpK [Methylosoma difficile]